MSSYASLGLQRLIFDPADYAESRIYENALYYDLQLSGAW